MTDRRILAQPAGVNGKRTGTVNKVVWIQDASASVQEKAGIGPPSF